MTLVKRLLMPLSFTCLLLTGCSGGTDSVGGIFDQSLRFFPQSTTPLAITVPSGHEVVAGAYIGTMIATSIFGIDSMADNNTSCPLPDPTTPGSVPICRIFTGNCGGEAEVAILYDNSVGVIENGDITFRAYCVNGATLNGTAKLRNGTIDTPQTGAGTLSFLTVDFDFDLSTIDIGPNHLQFDTPAPGNTVTFTPGSAIIDVRGINIWDPTTDRLMVYGYESMQITVNDTATSETIGVIDSPTFQQGLQSGFWHWNDGFVRVQTTSPLVFDHNVADTWPVSGLLRAQDMNIGSSNFSDLEANSLGSGADSYRISINSDNVSVTSECVENGTFVPSAGTPGLVFFGECVP